MFNFFGTLMLAAMTSAQLSCQGPSVPANCNRTATVGDQDTCFKISASHNVSTYQLACVNKGIIDDNCDNLHSGDCLCLGIKDQDCYDTYTVQLGDTCPGIAYMYNITQDTLEANNPGQCTHPRPLFGETLCVSSTLYKYTCPTQAA